MRGRFMSAIHPLPVAMPELVETNRPIPLSTAVTGFGGPRWRKSVTSFIHHGGRRQGQPQRSCQDGAAEVAAESE